MYAFVANNKLPIWMGYCHLFNKLICVYFWILINCCTMQCAMCIPAHCWLEIKDWMNIFKIFFFEKLQIKLSNRLNTIWGGHPYRIQCNKHSDFSALQQTFYVIFWVFFFFIFFVELTVVKTFNATLTFCTLHWFQSAAHFYFASH